MIDINVVREDMEQVVVKLNDSLSKIRTGRANPAMLDSVKVEAYGSLTPISQVALINVPEAKQLMIKPFDPSLLKHIEEGINKADLGINPTNDGEIIRLNIPALTEEGRRDFVKKAKDVGEGARVKIRNIRKDANNSIKKNDELSENEKDNLEVDVQSLTDEFNKKIDSILKAKNDDIMTI